MRVFIVRHGESEANLKNIFGTDSPLTENGKEQASMLASRLRLENIDAIISSPMTRALATAKIIAKFHPRTPFLIEEFIKEIYFGDWEGLSWEKIIQNYNQAVYMSAHEEYTLKVHNGESLEERVEKLIPIVAKWKKIYKNKTILLSTHGYSSKAVLIAFGVAIFDTGMQLQRFKNTSLTIIHPFDNDKIELLADANHLL